MLGPGKAHSHLANQVPTLALLACNLAWVSSSRLCYMPMSNSNLISLVLVSLFMYSFGGLFAFAAGDCGEDKGRMSHGV